MHGLNRPVTRQLPPVAQRRPAFSVHHGVELVDEYAWLRAGNWQEVMRDPSVLDQQIRAYLEAENAYTDAALTDTGELQSALYAEMKARIKEDDSSVPAPDGAHEYFVSYVTGGQYPRLCRRPRGGGQEQILLDGNKEAEGKPYWQLGAVAHSPDHRYLAYAVDKKGSELFTIKIRDLATGKDLREALPETRSSIIWGADSQTLFYVRLDRNQRPLYVYRHRLGTPGKSDVLIYEEKDKGFYVGVGQTQSSRFVTIEAHDHQTTEIYLIDADRPESEPRLVAPREHGHEYAVEHHGDALIITTNSAGAEDFRICEAPLVDPQRSNWREMIPHKPGRLILETVAFSGHLVRLEREDGLPRIAIRRFADGAEHAIDFDEEAYSLGMSAGYEFDTTTVRFTYSSMTTPAQVYDYDMETRARVLRKTQEVPSGHNPADYVTRRLHAPAPDGRPCRSRSSTRRERRWTAPPRCSSTATAPTASASQAAFSTSRLSLVDRGFIFASPTSAVARTRATAGTPRARAKRSSTPSRITSRRASSSCRKATPGAAASSPTAAPPAAC
jgi:oligopeptidase B